MASTSKKRARLARFVGSEKLVQIRRRSRPAYTVDGFVVVVGRKWVVLAQTMDGGFFDGHVAIRLRDIRDARASKSFEANFAKTRSEWPPSLPDGVTTLDADSTAGLLRTFLPPGHLFSIERATKEDAQWIGIPFGLKPRWLGMWQVTPQATWWTYPTRHRLRTITTVRRGESYQVGLAAMAGEPPAEALDGNWAFAEPDSNRRTTDDA